MSWQESGGRGIDVITRGRQIFDFKIIGIKLSREEILDSGALRCEVKFGREVKIY